MISIPRGSSPTSPTVGGLPLDVQRRLIIMRAALILGEGAGIILLAILLDARLPLLALVLILALHLALNAAA